LGGARAVETVDADEIDVSPDGHSETLRSEAALAWLRRAAGAVR